MLDLPARLDRPTPGAVAWLDISADNPDAWTGRRRTGPLGMQIAPVRNARAPYYFKGARLRGTRCSWSATTLSATELYRPAQQTTAVPFDASIQILARMEATGTVFAATGAASGVVKIIEPSAEISEQFLSNSHLYTLNIPRAAIGVEASTLRGMQDRPFALTPFQLELLRGAVGLLQTGDDELTTASTLVGVDRYLASMAALLLRTSVRRPLPDLTQIEQVRMRTDAIIYEQATDPELTPATIAAQLTISLRQLYRAFTGTESPAGRIRRRRLERAAEILAARSGPGHVERVAMECGFTSAEYFSRAFRREFGLSPRAYRSAHRDSGVRRDPQR